MNKMNYKRMKWEGPGKLAGGGWPGRQRVGPWGVKKGGCVVSLGELFSSTVCDVNPRAGPPKPSRKFSLHLTKAPVPVGP